MRYSNMRYMICDTDVVIRTAIHNLRYIICETLLAIHHMRCIFVCTPVWGLTLESYIYIYIAFRAFLMQLHSFGMMLHCGQPLCGGHARRFSSPILNIIFNKFFNFVAICSISQQFILILNNFFNFSTNS